MKDKNLTQLKTVLKLECDNKSILSDIIIFAKLL